MWFGHKGGHCLIAVEGLKLGVVCFLFCHEQTSLGLEFPACPHCNFPSQKEKIISAWMTKRIRGWQLEVEKEKGEPALGKAGHSQLATKLLQLWSHGQVSAKSIQELTLLAHLDGVNHPEIMALGKAGNFGNCPGNCHRDIMATFCREVHLSQPQLIGVSCQDPKSGQSIFEEAACFLPHILFSDLATSYEEQFSPIMAANSPLRSFWTATLGKGDERLKQHPITKDPCWMDCYVPLYLHGDGVEFHSKDSLLVFSFGSFCPWRLLWAPAY